MVRTKGMSMRKPLQRACRSCRIWWFGTVMRHFVVSSFEVPLYRNYAGEGPVYVSFRCASQTTVRPDTVI